MMSLKDAQKEDQAPYIKISKKLLGAEELASMEEEANNIPEGGWGEGLNEEMEMNELTDAEEKANNKLAQEMEEEETDEGDAASINCVMPQPDNLLLTNIYS